eukprot:985745-Pyramimonas_sp.AAC.1
MFLKPQRVLKPKTAFLQHEPDVLKQDSPSQKCSENTSPRHPQRTTRVPKPCGDPDSPPTHRT